MSRDAAGTSPVRALVFLTVSLLTGVVLVAVLFQMITSYQIRIEEAKRPEDTVMVIVAAREMYPGVSITEDDLYAVEIAPRYLPEGVFLSPEHVVGRIPRERVLANEFIRSDRLADPEDGIGLNAVIPRGMRALSLNLDGGAALAGHLAPGSYVDVLATLTPPDAGAPPITTTLVQAVFVLGVNSRMQRETVDQARQKRGSAAPSVTLLVTADQAEQIAHAQSLGLVTLDMRSGVDLLEAKLDGADLDRLRDVLMGPALVEKARISPRKVAPAPTGPREDETLIIVGPKRYHNSRPAMEEGN